MKASARGEFVLAENKAADDRMALEVGARRDLILCEVDPRYTGLWYVVQLSQFVLAQVYHLMNRFISV